MDHCSGGGGDLGRSSLAVGALLPLAPAWPEPREIPGRNPWEKSLGEVSSLWAPHQCRQLLAICSLLTSLGRAEAERKVLSLQPSQVICHCSPFPPRIKTNISSCILMKHLKVDLLLLFTCTVLIFFWPFLICPCVFVLFFFIFPSYLFDLVLHAAFFFEVIGELVIRDQLDSS